MREKLSSDVRARRIARGWSQDELSKRSGLSRAEVSAIETARLVPSTLAALALAEAFNCPVEHLFRRERPDAPPAAWAWPPRAEPARYWRAEVGGIPRLYPVEPGPSGNPPHDGLWPTDQTENPAETRFAASRTLVLASCDPAAGLLAAELARSAGIRLVVVSRSSRAALGLLRQGLVHLAGIHLAADGEGHAPIVEAELGPGHGLIRGATWEEGLALGRGLRLHSVGAALSSRLRWVGREAGSGARRCLDELLGPKRTPRREALDHRGVAEAVRCGWADAGVCLRLASEEAGLDFLPVRREAYDLAHARTFADDPRFAALLAVLQSPAYRKALGELPGYAATGTGDQLA